MLIDFLTAKIDLEKLAPATVKTLMGWGDRICRYNLATGEVVYETGAWDSVRSDSHQVTARVGSDSLYVQGSPARACGDGCAVFGSGPARELELRGCLRAMVGHLCAELELTLPLEPRLWSVSRVDVTANLELDSLADVRAALAALRNVEGGRYRVDQQAGDTVYWSRRSRLRKGKAYAKGPHLRHTMKRRREDEPTGRVYSPGEIEAADRLLRLELTLGAQWWRERAPGHWWEVTADHLVAQWRAFFERMLGTTELDMTDQTSVLRRLTEVAPTERQAQAAYATWLFIKEHGWQRARDHFKRPTWYRHLGMLRAAGLGDADISLGRVVPFRRSLIECRMVESWADLQRAA